MKNYTEKDFVKLVEKLRGRAEMDLSITEDLSLAVMNLISLEEHFFFTAEKTGKESYFGMMEEVRKLRKEALKQLVGSHEGETWCAIKHLLAATMRFIEVGTKLQSDGKEDEAKTAFKHAYKIYSIFWALRLKLVSVEDVKNIGDKNELKVGDKSITVEDLVARLANCCTE